MEAFERPIIAALNKAFAAQRAEAMANMKRATGPAYELIDKAHWAKAYTAAVEEPLTTLILDSVRHGIALVAPRNPHKGGEGSGNFGHEGRPGEVGGSAPGGGVGSEKNRSLVLSHLAEHGRATVEYGVCADKDGNVLYKQKGSATRVTLSREQVELTRGAELFIHNHPNGEGLSAGDLEMAQTLNVHTTVAVTGTSIHTVERTPESKRIPKPALDNINKNAKQRYKLGVLQMPELPAGASNEVRADRIAGQTRLWFQEYDNQVRQTTARYGWKYTTEIR